MATLSLSRAGKTFVFAVVVVGFALIAWSFVDLAAGRVPPHWLVLAALTVLSGSLAIRIPSVRATISVSEGLVFASALLFGPAAATVTVALDGLIVSLGARNRNIYRTLFALGEPAISVWTSAQLFYLMAGVAPLAGQPAEIEHLIAPLLLLTTTYFLFNSWLTATAVWFETGITPLRFLRDQLSHLSLNYLASLCLVVLLVQNTQKMSVTAAAVLLLLLAISYVSSTAAMNRIEEANRHLTELNTLYLSTVETLAMAIDAKDQITHGHIRRVQQQAVALARAVGVEDAGQIKAIEVAALLHDLGKLAVPEHILNKPGSLTPVEFERMKAHAGIGADILSHIDFPYPVTPIIRHHHENWNGSGYPDGLKGEAIPLGARILAVVDCFDALTSDRPYRRRLSPQGAMAILRARRGTMYDLRVVDAFVQLTATWQPGGCEPGVDERRAEAVTSLLVSPALTSRQYAARAQVSAEMSQTQSQAGGWPDRLAAALVDGFQHLAPEALCVLYGYDAGTTQLIASYVSEADHGFLEDLTIPLGKRVSGWVGANLRTIANSDAALDLGELVDARPPRLQTCLSLPIVRAGTLVGVATLYSPNRAGFPAEVVRAAELLAREDPVRESEQEPQVKASRRGIGSSMLDSLIH